MFLVSVVVKGEMEQPVHTVLFVLAQKSIIVIILKALNISTFFFCHFILTFRQRYVFRLLTQCFFNSIQSATLQWGQLRCISRLVSVLSGEGRDQHDHKFQLLCLFFFLIVSVWYFWNIFYFSHQYFAFTFPSMHEPFFFSSLPGYLSPSPQ